MESPCVTWGRSFRLSEPQFSHLSSGARAVPISWGCWPDLISECVKAKAQCLTRHCVKSGQIPRLKHESVFTPFSSCPETHGWLSPELPVFPYSFKARLIFLNQGFGSSMPSAQDSRLLMGQSPNFSLCSHL